MSTTPHNADDAIAEIQTHLYYTDYTKKIEYAAGKFGYFLIRHNWKSGEDFMIGPRELKGKTDASKQRNLEMHEFCKSQNLMLPYDTISFCGSFLPVSRDVTNIICDEDNGAFVFRYFKMRGHIPEPGETMRFCEFKQIHIKNNVITTKYLDSDKVIVWQEKDRKRILKGIVKRHQVLNFGDNMKLLLCKNLNNMYVKEHCSSCFYFDYMPTTRKNNKFQSKVDEYDRLVNSAIPKSAELALKSNDNKRNYFVETKSMVCERLADNLIVLRYFHLCGDDVVEDARMYVDDKDIYPCYFSNDSSVRCAIEQKDFWSSCNYETLDAKGTIIEKRYPYICNKPINTHAYMLLISKHYLIIEQLLKLGFSFDVAIDIAKRKKKRHSVIKQINTLSDLIAKKDYKRLDILKKDICYVDDLLDTISIVQKSNYIDFATFKSVIEHMEQCTDFRTITNYLRLLAMLSKYYNRGRLQTIAVDISKQYCLACKHRKNNVFDDPFDEYDLDVFHTDVISSHELYDTYRYCTLIYADNERVLRNKINTISKITEAYRIMEIHNELMTQYQHERETIRNKAVQKNLAMNQHLAFDDEKFLIKVPNNAEEIIAEGKAMSHCVASYTHAVANGESMIVFLRKKEDPDTPYATIELDKYGSIVQVKCKANMTLSSKSTFAFLSKWMQKKNLKSKTNDISWDGKTVSIGMSYRGYYIEDDSVCNS